MVNGVFTRDQECHPTRRMRPAAGLSWKDRCFLSTALEEFRLGEWKGQLPRGNRSKTNMTGNRKFLDSVRRTAPSVALAAAGIVWALCLPYEAGAQGGFSGRGHAIRPSGRLPVARVLAVSGPASAHWNGRSRPLEAGSGLEADEVIVTGARSTVLVKTADGGEFQIFPESQVRFRESRRTWLDPVDRWLSEIRTRMQRIERTQPCDSLSCPTAVLGVRAAILPSVVRGVAEFENKNRLGMRGRG
jgi:hypothetical protein